MNPFVERRKYARIEAKFRVRRPKGDGTWSEEMASDISRGGIFLRTTEVLAKVGETVELTLLFTSTQKGVRLKAQVMRHNAGGYGLKFMELTKRTEKEVEAFINKALGTVDDGHRSFTRVYRRVEVRFAGIAALQKTFVENISLGGMFLISEQKDIRGGDKISVVLVHPDSGREYLLTAEVIHVRPIIVGGAPGGQGLGVKFMDLDKKKKLELRAFVKDLVLRS